MIDDADELGDTEARRLALACVEAGIEATTPERVIERSLSLDGDALTVTAESTDGGGDTDGRSDDANDVTYDLAAYDRLLVVGGGKASGGTARALEALLGDRIDDGVVVTTDPEETERIEIVVGDHPVPSERGVEGARRVLDLVADADESTLVLATITGGASALLAAPVEGVSLEALQSTTNALLESGAEIDEINAVRKHLSAIKGGQLSRAAGAATVVGLVLSDVVGNDLSVIASGPTAPDDSTFADALSVLDRYGVDAPESVRTRLERGRDGDEAETPNVGDAAFERTTNHVLADGFTALAAARDVAEDRDYRPCILSSRVRGEAREAAKSHVAVAEEVVATGNPVSGPAVLLAGGETTVTVRGDGRGGPNQEFALAAALALRGRKREEAAAEVVVASVDTDGRDGGTDVAGALVDAMTVDDVAGARRALDDNDAFGYLDGRGSLLDTGPTGTNVNDLRVAVVARPER